MRLTQLTEGPCDVAKPEEIEKMTGTEYDKYAQWKKDCESDERTTPLSTKRLSASKLYASESDFDDYEGDMSQEEYDQTVDNSEMEYAVWVGGTEVNDKWLTYDEAITLYDKYKAQGYDDIKLDARIKDGHVSEETTEEGNEFSGELAKAKIDGKKEFKVGGKTYKVEETDEEQLDEILPVLAVGAAAAAVGTAAYKGGKAIGNWLAKKKTPTADAMPGDGMASDAAKGLEDRKKQMSKNLAALKSESAFSKKVKEAADEDAEAVSARDDFVNMMSSKPKSSNKAIDTIKQIVADKQNMQVKFDDGKMKVDLYTASAISQVYDAVKPETQEKIDNMLRTKEGMLKMSNFAFSKISEGLKEGKRLDEILPVVPLLIGAGRVLLPMAAKALAKKFGKKAVTNVIKKNAGKFKPGKNPNSIKTQIKKGGGDGILKQIVKKSPGGKTGLKTTSAISGYDMYKGGSGTGSTIGAEVWNNYKGNQKASDPSSGYQGTSTRSRTNMYDDEQTDGKVINEIQPEYTGADAIVDRNGKKHSPNSPKAKMIINMRKKNSGNKDSEEMSPKEIKAARLAQLKAQRQGEQKRDKTVRSVKKGFKKGMKIAGGLIGDTGFINPLAASKYSPEDKAMEMVEKAMDQALSEDK